MCIAQLPLRRLFPLLLPANLLRNAMLQRSAQSSARYGSMAATDPWRVRTGSHMAAVSLVCVVGAAAGKPTCVEHGSVICVVGRSPGCVWQITGFTFGICRRPCTVGKAGHGRIVVVPAWLSAQMTCCQYPCLLLGNDTTTRPI